MYFIRLGNAIDDSVNRALFEVVFVSNLLTAIAAIVQQQEHPMTAAQAQRLEPQEALIVFTRQLQRCQQGVTFGFCQTTPEGLRHLCPCSLELPNFFTEMNQESNEA